MARGGGGVVVLAVGGAALACGYLYLSGKLPGFGKGVPTAKAPELDGAKEKIDAFVGTPMFYTALVAAVLATLGIITWGKIGGWGRAVVLVCAAIAVTIFVIR
jgi:hypothetical protein